MIRGVIRVLLLWLAIGVPASVAQEKEGSAPAAQPQEVFENDPAEDASEGTSIVECYDAAVANLERICEDYQRIKALELSKVRDIAFLDAYENIQSVMPILKTIDRDLLQRPIMDPNDIGAHKREVEKVEAEVATMIDLVARLLLEIEAVQQQMAAEAEGAEQEPISLEDIVNAPDYDPNSVEEAPENKPQQENPVVQQLTEKAKEKEEEPAVDLTTEMRALSQTPPETEADAKNQPPLPGSAPSRDEEKDRKKQAKPVLASPKTAGQIAGTSFKRTEQNYEVGRKVVSEGGAPVEWMFVDTWYTIGPFPNPKRINLNKKFPPETVVNLSATYRGKDDRIVGWEFLQSNRIKCVPLHDEEFAIYYAYTELWFDQPMELWVAIGSDDKANVWINGLPVWISGDQLKPWRINEGLRKVHFKEGVNTVLFRVENGWKGTSFSMGIEVRR